MRGRCTWLALVVSLCLSLPTYADEDLELFEDETPESLNWTDVQEKKGSSCMDICLADGETLFDCEYHCILQANSAGGPTVACR